MTSEQRKLVEAVQVLRHCPTVSVPEEGFIKIPSSLYNRMIRDYDAMIISMANDVGSGGWCVVDPGGTPYCKHCGRVV